MKILLIALLLFVVSFFLPAFNPAHGEYSGYDCALFCLFIISEGRDFADIPFIAFCFFCVGMILRYIVTAKEVDFEVVCASVSAYLLIAITWAVSYRLIYGLRPESFRVAEGGAEMNLDQFIYFSLTTITTLGYGDMTPVSVPVGIWATVKVIRSEKPYFLLE